MVAAGAPPERRVDEVAQALGDRLGAADLGEAGPLSQGSQVGRQALRTRHINGMKVRKKRPGEFK
jgi:hypothetical protein